MTDLVRDWKDDLVEAHPTLFRPIEGRAGRSCRPECGEGWRDLLERACVRIRAAVEADGGSFTAVQIKEKFGTLRFYWRGDLSDEAKAKVDEAIELAEARSACTCEVCGGEGRLHRSGYWLTTRCDAHAQGAPVGPEADGENVVIVQRVVGKRTSFRRYDRAADAFLDIDLPSGIEEE